MGLDALSSICKWNPGHLSCESQGGRLPAWHCCCHDNGYTHMEHNVLIKIRLKARNKTIPPYKYFILYFKGVKWNTEIWQLAAVFPAHVWRGRVWILSFLNSDEVFSLWLSWFPNIHTRCILRPHTTSFVSIIQDAAMLQIFIKLAWRFLVINFAGIQIKKRRSRKKFRLSWFWGNLVVKQVK